MPPSTCFISFTDLGAHGFCLISFPTEKSFPKLSFTLLHGYPSSIFFPSADMLSICLSCIAVQKTRGTLRKLSFKESCFRIHVAWDLIHSEALSISFFLCSLSSVPLSLSLSVFFPRVCACVHARSIHSYSTKRRNLKSQKSPCQNLA